MHMHMSYYTIMVTVAMGSFPGEPHSRNECCALFLLSHWSVVQPSWRRVGDEQGERERDEALEFEFFTLRRNGDERWNGRGNNGTLAAREQDNECWPQ